MQIPKPLQAQQDIFLATKMPFVQIEPFETSEVLSPWTSKYRGLPYLPEAIEYPQDENGRPLALLAQINFSEVPKLEGYPTAGILQFFIADDHEFYGANFGEVSDLSEQFQLLQQQINFRVVYYPEVIYDLDRLTTAIDLPEFEDLPVARQCRLEFFLQEAFVGLEDYRFKQRFGKDFLSRLSDRESDELWKSSLMRSQGNKIGGYASFAQIDVRESAPASQNWLLLLQIDHAAHASIGWGGGGVGNFFIEEKALQSLDFSHVLYNWDCG